jgi:hypothetical protein
MASEGAEKSVGKQKNNHKEILKGNAEKSGELP